MEGKMDSNVIEFPTRTVRNWVAIENIIQKNLQKAGASPEMTQEVCARMKESWEKFDIQLTFALELPPMPEGLRNIVNNSVQKALEGLKKKSMNILPKFYSTGYCWKYNYINCVLENDISGIRTCHLTSHRNFPAPQSLGPASP